MYRRAPVSPTTVALMPRISGADDHRGRVFETEGIATLSSLLLRYQIHVKDDPRYTGESFEARKERMLRCKAGHTLT